MEHTVHTGHKGHMGHMDHTSRRTPHNHKTNKPGTDSHSNSNAYSTTNERKPATSGGQPRGPDARFLLWATMVSKGSSVICVSLSDEVSCGPPLARVPVP